MIVIGLRALREFVRAF